MKLFISILLALSLTACNQKKNLSTSESTSAVVQETSTSFNNDCFKDRAVTKEVTDIEVKMVEIMNTYMFSFDNTRWQACEVPTAFHQEGMMVKVSGQVLEIKPNERRAGTPFNITAISKM